MDEDAMADAIAWHLNQVGGGWKAEFSGLGEIDFTNEDGEKFVLEVRAVEEFDR